MKNADKAKEQLMNELKELRKKLAELEGTMVDNLTGLYSRSYFLDLAEREFARAHRFERPLSAVILDIDYLKQVDDSYSDAIGDQVISAVAELCRTNVRDVDFLGRYEGGKFVLLLPEAEVPVARQIAERLRKLVSGKPVSTESGPIDTTISLGVAALTADTVSFSELLERADKAMHAAKERGRNCVEIE